MTCQPLSTCLAIFWSAQREASFYAMHCTRMTASCTYTRSLFDETTRVLLKLLHLHRTCPSVFPLLSLIAEALLKFASDPDETADKIIAATVCTPQPPPSYPVGWDTLIWRILSWFPGTLQSFCLKLIFLNPAIHQLTKLYGSFLSSKQKGD